MPTITYYPDRAFPPSSAGVSFDGRYLAPGENEVTEDELVFFTSHPDFSRYVKWGAIEFAEEPEPEELETEEIPLIAESLSGLNAEDAIELVKLTDSIEVLQSFLEAETRKTVRVAIEARLKELEA